MSLAPFSFFPQSPGAIPIVITDTCNPGRFAIVPGRYTLVHPRDYLLLQIELTSGTTYAQRLTMRGLVLSRWNRSRKLWVFDALRARVRHLDGVRP